MRYGFVSSHCVSKTSWRHFKFFFNNNSEIFLNSLLNGSRCISVNLVFGHTKFLMGEVVYASWRRR